MINKLKSLFGYSGDIKQSNSLYSKFTQLLLRVCFISSIRVSFYEQLASLQTAENIALLSPAS